MAVAANLTPREVAELSHVPKRVIEKAIEERVLRVQFRAAPGATRRVRRLLPEYAVAYATIMSKLDVKLGLVQKKRLAVWLAHAKPGQVRKARLELAPALHLDVGRLVGDAMDRAERYRSARDALIILDKAIMGGTPVVRGTRMTVYSVLGRIEHGDTVADILADNPNLSREAIEAAIIYARAHPLMGRPGGRPWVDAA
jgi:uncharacterized protein (DUF433 family)